MEPTKPVAKARRSRKWLTLGELTDMARELGYDIEYRRGGKTPGFTLYCANNRAKWGLVINPVDDVIIRAVRDVRMEHWPEVLRANIERIEKA
ncbi:TPA: hypothetical protein LU109_003610 [Enterobacter hormaechei subsp. xiangfangensis]|nr:hypothetical protein [Enterobacter hormaechei subsp. xiangfangensis]